MERSLHSTANSEDSSIAEAQVAAFNDFSRRLTGRGVSLQLTTRHKGFRTGGRGLPHPGFQ